MKNNVPSILISLSIFAVAMLGSMAPYVSAEDSMLKPTAIPSIPAVPSIPGDIPDFPKYPTILPGPTATPTPTPAPTVTPAPEPSAMPEPTAIPSATPGPTATPAPEVTIPWPTTAPHEQATAPVHAIVYTVTPTPTPESNVTRIPLIGINGVSAHQNPWPLFLLLIVIGAVAIGVRTTYRKK